MCKALLPSALACLAGALLLQSGCSNTPNEPISKFSILPEKPLPPATHGGKLVWMPGNVGILEFVLEDAGKLTVYSLGAQAQEPLPLEQDVLTVGVFRAERNGGSATFHDAFKFTIPAIDATEQDGTKTAAVFSGASEELSAWVQDKETLDAQVVANVAGQGRLSFPVAIPLK